MTTPSSSLTPTIVLVDHRCTSPHGSNHMIHAWGALVIEPRERLSVLGGRLNAPKRGRFFAHQEAVKACAEVLQARGVEALYVVDERAHAQYATWAARRVLPGRSGLPALTGVNAHDLLMRRVREVSQAQLQLIQCADPTRIGQVLNAATRMLTVDEAASLQRLHAVARTWTGTPALPWSQPNTGSAADPWGDGDAASVPASPPPPQPPLSAAQAERRVLRALESGTKGVRELAALTGLNPVKTGRLMRELEERGVVTPVRGAAVPKYRLATPAAQAPVSPTHSAAQ